MNELLGLFKFLGKLLDVRCEVLIVLLVKDTFLLQEARHQEVKDGPKL